MNSLPCPAKLFQVCQSSLNMRQFSFRKPIIFAKLYRSSRTIQIQYGFTASADRMDMNRSMIVEINDYAQSIKSENRRHFIIKPKRLGYKNRL